MIVMRSQGLEQELLLLFAVPSGGILAMPCRQVVESKQNLTCLSGYFKELQQFHSRDAGLPVPSLCRLCMGSVDW